MQMESMHTASKQTWELKLFTIQITKSVKKIIPQSHSKRNSKIANYDLNMVSKGIESENLQIYWISLSVLSVLNVLDTITLQDELANDSMPIGTLELVDGTALIRQITTRCDKECTKFRTVICEYLYFAISIQQHENQLASSWIPLRRCPSNIRLVPPVGLVEIGRSDAVDKGFKQPEVYLPKHLVNPCECSEMSTPLNLTLTAYKSPDQCALAHRWSADLCLTSGHADPKPDRTNADGLSGLADFWLSLSVCPNELETPSCFPTKLKCEGCGSVFLSLQRQYKQNKITPTVEIKKKSKKTPHICVFFFDRGRPGCSKRPDRSRIFCTLYVLLRHSQTSGGRSWEKRFMKESVASPAKRAGGNLVVLQVSVCLICLPHAGPVSAYRGYGPATHNELSNIRKSASRFFVFSDSHDKLRHKYHVRLQISWMAIKFSSLKDTDVSWLRATYIILREIQVLGGEDTIPNPKTAFQTLSARRAILMMPAGSVGLNSAVHLGFCPPFFDILSPFFSIEAVYPSFKRRDAPIAAMDVLVSRIRLVFQSNASKLPDPLSRKRIKCLTIKIIVTTSSPFVVSSLHKCMRITLGWFCVHIYLNTYIQLLSLRYSKKKKDPHFHKSHGDKSWPRDWHVDKCIYNHLMLGALMPFGGINLVPLNFPAPTHPMDA
ncbi:hypothetical protein VP01_1774g1 [Puccinia sorghi]|uniref:Uncharacterized protein n=1 Tax=Puccinia sorghi TaxID=27349 RepID=A0A0L6VEP4_9BASI|nr:hypothetical protein VP01_1774g1 [Puccinia sorghi]